MTTSQQPTPRKSLDILNICAKQLRTYVRRVDLVPISIACTDRWNRRNGTLRIWLQISHDHNHRFSGGHYLDGHPQCWPFARTSCQLGEAARAKAVSKNSHIRVGNHEKLNNYSGWSELFYIQPPSPYSTSSPSGSTAHHGSSSPFPSCTRFSP